MPHTGAHLLDLPINDPDRFHATLRSMCFGVAADHLADELLQFLQRLAPVADYAAYTTSTGDPITTTLHGDHLTAASRTPCGRPPPQPCWHPPAPPG